MMITMLFHLDLSGKNAHQSQIIGGDADVDHTQTIGGGYSQIILLDAFCLFFFSFCVYME